MMVNCNTVLQMETIVYCDNISVCWSAASMDTIHLSELPMTSNIKYVIKKRIVTFLGHQIDVRGRRVVRLKIDEAVLARSKLTQVRLQLSIDLFLV